MAQPGEFSMTYDVVVYVSSVANAVKHPRKVACLESFAQGAKKLGCTVHTEYQNRYSPSKLAVILGWATPQTQGGANVALRKQVIANQRTAGNHTMCIDASCFKYTDDTSRYLRYSIGGPYYDKACYANVNSGDQQWQRIKQDLKLELKPTQIKSSGHILICMQRDGGFAMKNLNPLQWLDDKLHQIRDISRLPIVIRPHPGAYRASDFVKYGRMKNISVCDPKKISLIHNLQGAYCAVFFNSSASVAAVLEGVPVFVDDVSAVTWAVSNHSINDLPKPLSFDRSQWIYDLAAAHWSDDDSAMGKIYQQFEPYL